MQMFPQNYSFGEALGTAMGGGLSQGFGQGRDQSLVQNVLSQMQNTDPSQFAQIMGNAEAQLGNNPQALSALQRGAQKYEAMREDGIAQELLEDEKFISAPYEKRVAMAMKAGLPAQKALGLIGELQAGEIQQSKMMTPLKKMEMDHSATMDMLKQQYKDAMTPDEKAKVQQLINDEKLLYRDAKQNYRELQKLDPQAAREIGMSYDYQSLGDPGTIAAIKASLLPPREEEEKSYRQSEGGVSSGESGAPQVPATPPTKQQRPQKGPDRGVLSDATDFVNEIPGKISSGINRAADVAKAGAKQSFSDENLRKHLLGLGKEYLKPQSRGIGRDLVNEQPPQDPNGRMTGSEFMKYLRAMD